MSAVGAALWGGRSTNDKVQSIYSGIISAVFTHTLYTARAHTHRS